MKKRYPVIILVLVLVLSCANYQSVNKNPDEKNIQTIDSPFLLEPDRALEFTIPAADFWKNAYDPEYGGFFTVIDYKGMPVMGETLKTVLTQSRNAYAFAKAYMLTGDEEYLIYGRYALDFMYEYCWDKENEGFHTCLNRKGENIDFSTYFPLDKMKWSFMQHYALLGIAAMYEAGRDSMDYDFLIKARGVLDEKLWDSTPQYRGYYELAEYDWSNPQDKGFTPTVDCITTHGLSIYLLTEEDMYLERLVELADNIIDHMIPTMDTRKIGFEEKYDAEWNEKYDSFLFIGHMLKTAWCLGRVYLIEENKKYLEAAEKIMKQVWEKAWDHENGGPYSFANSIEGFLLNEIKSWWILEQAITAGLILFHITGNELYLEMADQSVDFFTKYQIDWEYGEAFAYLDKTGNSEVDQQGRLGFHFNKGDYWRGGYHTVETGYYLYTYGNLYVHHKPVTLYYHFDKEEIERNVRLNPISIEDDSLIITSVELDEEEYSNFISSDRILIIPAGLEGEFKVVFEVTN
jgi:mannose/cellobiose epimerase-like protein (N-acyl-D-glucosamine 2-epimerase family)